MPNSASCNRNEEAAQNQAVKDTSFFVHRGTQGLDGMVGVPEVGCLH